MTTAADFSFKLTYFPLAGRAGAIRDAFKLAKIPFDDHILSFADFSAKKADFPLKSLPVLEITRKSTGKTVVHCQSNAILRFVGAFGGLCAHADPLSCLAIDEILAVCEDLGGAVSPSMHEKDPEKKASLRQEFAETKLPMFFARLQTLLQEYTEDDGAHMVGDSLTVADLKALHSVNWMRGGILDGVDPNLIDSFPALALWHSKIKEEVATRTAA